MKKKTNTGFLFITMILSFLMAAGALIKGAVALFTGRREGIDMLAGGIFFLIAGTILSNIIKKQR